MLYVLRPPGILTTPRLITNALNANHPGSYRLLSPRSRQGERSLGLCLYYPTRGGALLESPRRPRLLGSPGDWSSLRTFSSSNKYQQRSILASHGLPVPVSYNDRGSDGDGVPSEPSATTYIVRPLRHRAGEHYRITQNRNDFRPGHEYISEVFPKRHEYRIIYSFGTHLFTLYKRVPDSLSQEEAWNHTKGSSFITVNNPDNDRLRHTDVYSRLVNNPIIQAAHLVGVDVLLGRQHQYVICEFNFCPAITLPNNLERLAAHVHSQVPL